MRHFSQSTSGPARGRTVTNIPMRQEIMRRVSHIRFIQGIMVVCRPGGARVYCGRDAIAALFIVTTRNHLRASPPQQPSPARGE